MNNPEIDVIIAVYNGAAFIEAAIVSVQAQTWKRMNIIVADDGSTDNTVAIIKNLGSKDKRISILTLPHQGVAATLNAAIQYSTAPYIAFLDADDLWQEDKLEKQIAALKAHDVSLCFCLMQEFESFNTAIPQRHHARSLPLRGYSKITFLGERNLFHNFGLFKEEVAIGDFVEWYSRLVRAAVPFIMVEEVLAFRRVHQNNTTSKAPKTAFLELLKSHLDEQRKNAE